MPPSTTTQIRLDNIAQCLATTASTLTILSDHVDASFLVAISNTSQSLAKCIQTIKYNKNDCIQLLEQVYQLLTTITVLHIGSDNNGELPPDVIHNVAKFTETLHKIHTFVEAQQNGSKFKNFFRQGEMNTLLKACQQGLQEEATFFQIKTGALMGDITTMQRDAEKRHRETLQMIEVLSADGAGSDRASSISQVYSGSSLSSNSFSMLPPEPKIFHGRESELGAIVGIFTQESPRVALLGAGGMGKTSVARALLHQADITAKFGQHRLFVACDSVANKVELAALIGAHLGLMPRRDLTRAVLEHFATSPPSLLILDNLEPLWEPAHLRQEITMRGLERPGKVRWTRPFIPPLERLAQDAARKIFIDIADDDHDLEEIDKVLCLTDNVPLAISLLAHLVDSEGCTNILSRWEVEKTSLLSEGYDRRSNLDLSISISLTSPRITSTPDSQELLGLLSMLPDGLSDVELLQTKLPMRDISRCKLALIRTALGYVDGQKRLKVLVPIREYMQRNYPPRNDTVRPLLVYFQDLLKVYSGNSSNRAVPRIISNYANIQNVVQHGLQPDHPDLKDSIYCACRLNSFSRLLNQQKPPLMEKIYDILPTPCDHRLEVYFIMELFSSWKYYAVPNAKTLITRALEHFTHFDDSDLKCRFYLSLTYHHTAHDQDLAAALDMCQRSLALSVSTANIRRQSETMYCFASCKWDQDDPSAAQQYAYEAGRLARISADLYREAQAHELEAVCWYRLGNYTESISLCNRARDLLYLCGISSGHLYHHIMNTQAEVHRLKSEYVEARRIQIEILQEPSIEQDPHGHGLTLHNVAQIDVQIDAPKDDIQRNIDQARGIFNHIGHAGKIVMCDVLQAELDLHTVRKMHQHVLGEGF
ncbi:hypothetical protein C8R47DRAFT_1160868 [Mycena vitilis]|nr:hypothetical protein C8R47DRAFT_1160868 [Mycena vitilis]